MMKPLTTIALASLLTSTVACFDTTPTENEALGGTTATSGSTADPATAEFALALPSAEDVALNLPADPAPNALRVGEMAKYYADTAQITGHVNGMVYGILSVVGDITDTPPSAVEDDMAAWGPFTPALELATFLLVVRRVADHEYEYALLIRHRTSTDDDDFRPVLVGRALPGDGGARDQGGFLVDWTEIARIDPLSDLRGTMAVHYEAVPLQFRTVEVGFQDFVDVNGEDTTPTDVLYRYLEDSDTSGEFQFAYRTDVHDEPDKAGLELVRTRSRWTETGTGRADVRVTSSEIAADLATIGLDQDFVAAEECWDAGFLRTYYNEWPVRLSEDDGEPNDQWDGPGMGDPTLCPFRDGLEADGDVTVL